MLDMVEHLLSQMLRDSDISKSGGYLYSSVLESYYRRVEGCSLILSTINIMN
jgi:hypothetical protein